MICPRETSPQPLSMNGEGLGKSYDFKLLHPPLHSWRGGLGGRGLGTRWCDFVFMPTKWCDSSQITPLPIYTPQDTEYEHLDWLLDNIPNPRRTRGRRWLAI